MALVASDVNRNSPVQDKLLAVEKVTPGQGVIVRANLPCTKGCTEVVGRCNVDGLGVHVGGEGDLGGHILEPDRLERLRDSKNKYVGLARVTNHM